MDASRYAGLEDRGDALEEGVQPREKAKRISSAGDVAALTALAFGGLVGVVLLPVIIAARCVHGCYKLGKRKLAKSDPEQQVQDCEGIWPYINVHDDGGLHRLPDGTMRLAGYVKMSDGVRIAIDVLLPRQAQGADGSLRPVPCVLHMARYWRAWEMRWPFRELVNGGQPWDFLLGPWKSALLKSGFAVVSADVRGAGASSGTQSVVWSPRETQDTLELIDFIVGGSHAVTTQRARQPWSDGQVALFGVSYDAGAAVRAAAHQHPAVKALVASFLFGDIWRELFPGGIMNRWFLQSWCDVNSRLDNCRLSAIHPFAPLAMKGAAPASSKQQLARHVAEHSANWDLMSAAGSVAAIDDPVSISSGETMTCQNLELFSDPLPSLEGKAVLPSVAASQLPVLIISGWSCVTSGNACATFSALAGKHWRLLVGPWNHGGVQHVRYCRDTKLLKFPKAHAVQDFLLHHMQPKSQTPEWLASPQPEAHFYLCGAAPAWQHSIKWPPEGVVKKPLWLSGSKTLSWTESELESEGASQLPKATGAKQVVWGGVSRYMAMIRMMDLVKYKWNQSSIAKGHALLFESAPSNEPLAVIGSPVLSLRLKSSRDQDADVFAYLCERPPNGGDLVYVTEGILRLSYRKEEDAPSHEKAADPPSEAGVVPHHSYRRREMEMLPPEGEFTTARLKFFPVAYRFRAGSRVALVICPDDATHYASNPLAGQHPPFICHSKSEQSLLWLPIQQDMTAAGTAL